jgi:hypothetical protein
MKVTECDGVYMPGVWLSGQALHDLHQAYREEKAKREAMERTIDILEHLDRVYTTAHAVSDTGVSWAWWVTLGAASFAGGLVTGVYLAK